MMEPFAGSFIPVEFKLPTKQALKFSIFKGKSTKNITKKF